MPKSQTLKKLLSFLLLANIVATGFTQNKKTVPTPPSNPPPVAPSAPKSGPKPYKEVITDKALSRYGLFAVHKVDDRWFFEIGDSILGKEILVVNRISKAPIDTRAGFFGYAGDEINQNVIRFEKGPNNKLFFRNLSYSVYAKDSSKPMYKSVMNSNIQPITAAFDIKAFSKDSTGSVIDLTDYINGDNEIFFFAPSYKSALRLGSLQNDKSYVADIRPYPLNTEIRTVKTYSRASMPSNVPGFPVAPPGGFSTFELNTSIVLLPSNPMRPRYYDQRVAYITTEYTDFDADPQGVKDISMVMRWRLEPKPGDEDKYRRGELVEPKKQIVFYIDPATPEKWIPYLIQGVNDWKKAFEKAGFKNAITAKRAPSYSEDSTWSLEDARYSAIVYKPSDIPNASGPRIHDPRSGEILESHINWYHNVMRLLRNWYLVQAGASDPRARKPRFDDELMGQLIRFVSSHEVGHTLGLPHNMGASFATPVEKLRDKEWLEKYGHSSSIMDYARFNYVAQPEDKINPEGLYPRIGDYDLWAIEWGYKLFPGKDEDQEKKILNDLVKSKTADPRLRFLHLDGMDPRAQTEDLGDNSIKASTYGIRNLKKIVPNLPEWLNEEGESFDILSEVYNEAITQFGRYIGHVATHVAGVKTDHKTAEQEGPVYSIVPKTQQKEALNFIHRNLFETPQWILDKKILNRINPPTTDRVATLQENFLNGLLSPARLQRLIVSTNRDETAYPVDEYIEDIKKGIWSELSARKPIDNYRRNLQKSFIDRLNNLITPGSSPSPSGGGIIISFGPPLDPRRTDMSSVAKAILRSLKSEVNVALPTYTDKMSRYHLQDVAERLERILNPRS
jgi:hypothetical protein